MNEGCLCRTVVPAQAIGPEVLLTTNVGLNVSQGRGKLTLSWPVAGSGFVVESSPVLGAGAVWTSVDSPVVADGANNQVVMAPTHVSLYFRLKR
jgi:hypothetical protein